MATYDFLVFVEDSKGEAKGELHMNDRIQRVVITGASSGIGLDMARAFHALTVALAAELARHKIRVNTLAPGIIRTPLIPDADSLAAIHPLGRVGEVRDTSEAAPYLATAGFVTGTTLAVDGGCSHGR